MSGWPYHLYKPYGPVRGVPRLTFIPFRGHRTMEEVIADEERKARREAKNDTDGAA